jgi:hypothetical protein
MEPLSRNRCSRAEPPKLAKQIRGDPGIVLRRPHCDNVLARIVQNDLQVLDRPRRSSKRVKAERDPPAGFV